jgi:hypothetical protein
MKSILILFKYKNFSKKPYLKKMKIYVIVGKDGVVIAAFPTLAFAEQFLDSVPGAIASINPTKLYGEEGVPEDTVTLLREFAAPPTRTSRSRSLEAEEEPVYNKIENRLDSDVFGSGKTLPQIMRALNITRQEAINDINFLIQRDLIRERNGRYYDF